MKIIVAGSRGFKSFSYLRSCLDQYIEYLVSIGRREPMEIVSGTAAGADALGEKYADIFELTLHKFPANWEQHGRQAGPVRNGEMAKFADTLVAFWDGRSSGTLDMIRRMAEVRKPFRVHGFTNEDTRTASDFGLTL